MTDRPDPISPTGSGPVVPPQLDGQTIALIAGEDDAEVRLLGAAASMVLAGATTYLALVVGGDEVDAELAWGTRGLCVRPLGLPGAGNVSGNPLELPLPETGDAAAAVLEVARHLDADVIVAAGDRRGRVARLLSGSATDDLVQDAHIPVLIINGAR